MKTGMMVRAQGILTQLLFDHALRIRVKAEAHRDPTVSAPSTAAPTPDNASIAEGSSNDSGEETAGSVASATVKGKQREPSSAPSVTSSTTKVDKEKDASPEKTNLAGRLNNLATTDMESLVNGRDFLFIGE